MSEFTGELSLTHMAANWRLFRLNESFGYELGTKGSEKWVTVPAGFETDGASVPRLLWWFLPTWGSYSRAAVIHDYLYDLLLNEKKLHPHVQTRKKADDVFYEAMRVLEVPRYQAWLMWVTVRAFGGFPIVRRLQTTRRHQAKEAIATI